VLAVLAAAAALVAGALVARHRRANARTWDSALERTATEATREARDVLPALLAGTRESRRGGWAVARDQVVALEDEVSALGRSAPDEQRAATAEALRGALADVRRALDAEAEAPGEAAREALTAARQALARLEDRLAVVATGSGTPPPG
jgi:hypothetical protein